MRISNKNRIFQCLGIFYFIIEAHLHPSGVLYDLFTHGNVHIFVDVYNHCYFSYLFDPQNLLRDMLIKKRKLFSTKKDLTLKKKLIRVPLINTTKSHPAFLFLGYESQYPSPINNKFGFIFLFF